MVIRVNPSKAVQAAVSYVEPEFRAQWLDVQVVAESSFPDFLGVEILTPTDAVSLEPQKNVADTIAAPTDDLTSINLSKLLIESLVLTDSIHVEKLFIRSFGDSVTVPDLYTVEVQVPHNEAASTSDSSLLGVDKGLQDAFNLIDNMDGNLSYAVVKGIGELLIATDGQVIDFTTQMSDNMLTSSSGVAVVQNYSDITYFSTDFVGESRAFT